MSNNVTRWRGLISEVVAEVWPSLPDGPLWIEAQMSAESAGHPDAVSPVGAEGLMQLMPGTAAEVGVTNRRDPRQSLTGGVRYLEKQYAALGEVPSWQDRLLWSFASYNCGRGYIDASITTGALALAKRDGEKEWWRWDVGRYFLMHRDCRRFGRAPDHRQVWKYVERIRGYVRDYRRRAGGQDGE